MGRTGITVKLEGFEELLKEIEKAGGSINTAAESCIRQSAQIVQSELKSAMKSKAIEADFVNRMPQPQIEIEGNVYSATIGYEKGEYDPKNPSDGYLAAFLNYGTPHRKKHGQVSARGFIPEAKKASSRKVKKAQKEALEKILQRLEK